MATHIKLLAVFLCSGFFLPGSGLIPTAAAQAPERVTADTPKATVNGNTFIAPKDWSLAVKGRATILETPEGGSYIALVDIAAKDGGEALAEAWKAFKPEAKWPVKVSNDLPDRDGWSKRREYEYLTSPNEKRTVFALVFYSGTSWTVVIGDMADVKKDQPPLRGWSGLPQQPRIPCCALHPGLSSVVPNGT
jgi:hypothetical protein